MRAMSNKKNVCKISLLFVAVFLWFAVMHPITGFAEEAAVFHVQTAEVNGDGTIQIKVYLTGAANVGGIDAELIYDETKVSFKDAGLGKTLDSKYADVYHNEEKSLIKYVVLYPEAQDAHGVLMEAEFTLKEGESYQPELKVVDLVDDSDEIKEISYTVTYQQSDGTWEETPDISGTAADETVIDQAMEAFGSKEDQNEAQKNETTGNEALSESADNAESEADGSQDNEVPNDSGRSDKSGQEETESLSENEAGQRDEKESNLVNAVVIGIAAAAAVIVCIYLIHKKKCRKREEGL